MTDHKIIELTPFRANLTRAMACRGEWLLAAADLAEEVAGLEPLEIYYIVREIGLDRALPILLELSSEQLEGCVDLDCWNRYDFAADSLDEWLAAFAQDGPESLARAFLALDYVVQLLFLTQTITVYDPDMDQVPPEDEADEPSRAMTPDAMYLLELKHEIPLKTHPFALLDALYGYDSATAHRLLSDVRVDLPTQIEEEALRFRNGRMQDIGFVAPGEASVLFSRPTSRQLSSPRPYDPLDSVPTRMPYAYADSLNENTLLEQALAQITDRAALSRLEQELVWAINSAVIAYGEKNRESQQITDIAGRVRDTISLGLEVLLAQAEPDCPPEGAAAAVQTVGLLEVWCLTDLFRHGFAATLALQQEVRHAMAEPRFSEWYNLADPSQSDEPGDRLDRAFVEALSGRHPLRGGFDLARAEKVKAFVCLAEINVAKVRLQRLVARICDQS